MRPELIAVTVVEVFGYIGIVVATIIAIAVAYVAFHIWKFKRAINQFGKSFKDLGEAMKQGPIPQDLGLERGADDLLTNEPAAMEQVHRMQTAGLRLGGYYTSRHMAGVKLATLADPQRCVSASIATAPVHGVMIDVVTMYDDGSAVTHRTLKSLGLDHPPEFRNVHVPNASADELLRRHLSERDDKPARAIEPSEVADAMEEFNQAVLRWRSARGGLSEAEVRRNLQIMGTSADDISVKMVVAASQAEAGGRHRQEMAKSLLPLIGWDQAQWEQAGDRVIFVQDGVDAEDLVDEFFTAEASPSDDAIEHFMQSADEIGVRKAVAAFVAEHPQLGITFLATAHRPIQFDAYLRPANGDDE